VWRRPHRREILLDRRRRRHRHDVVDVGRDVGDRHLVDGEGVEYLLLTLRLFGVEMTGAWLETEEDVIESRAQLRNRVGSLLEEGELPDERRDEVLNALEIDERPVSDIMVAADDIVALSTDRSPEENFDRIRDTPHTRFPLVGDELTDFRGIVYAPSIIDHFEELKAGELSFEEIAAPTMTLSTETNVSDAFDQFQAEDQEIGLVLEGGEVVGLLTATDTLEAVMGDLEDPLDRQAEA